MKNKVMFSILLIFFRILGYNVLVNEIHEATENRDFEKVKTMVKKNPTSLNVKDDKKILGLLTAYRVD